MPKSRSVLLAVVATLAVAVAGRARLGATGGGGGPALPPGVASVTRVIDGDTIAVRLGGGAGRTGRTERVRLLGIDTPESVKPRTPVQCFAHQATARTSSLLRPGARVRLVRDVEARDRYGRLLAYVYRSTDGVFVNLALVQEGYAATLTIPPNVAHAAELASAADAARQAGRGLWGQCGGPHEPPP
jgi:micrococcal nuclease